MPNEVKKSKAKLKLRVLHRYLGYFMVGLVLFYVLTGTLLLFRDTALLKNDIPMDATIQKHLNKDQLIARVRLDKKFDFRHFKVKSVDGNIITFKKGRYNTAGTYNATTGELKYVKKEYSPFVSNILDLHKNKISNPSSFINISFVLSLLIFVITSFFMFDPKSPIFKKGMIFVAAGVLYALLAVFFL